MKRIFTILCFGTLSYGAFAQTPKPQKAPKTSDPEKLSVKGIAQVEIAKQKMYSGQYKPAMGLFKEVLIESPKNSSVLYYVADCSHKLGDDETAVQYLQTGKNATSVKNETYYLLGVIYQGQGKTDEALAEFNTFKSKASSGELKETDVDINISQCNNAKKYMVAPVSVQVENLGQKVNSKYDDKGPAITADGKKLFFNSRRPESDESPIDVEGDGKYFESIYYTTWDSAAQQWTEASQIPGQINQDRSHVACTGISPDGKQIFIYKNDLNNPESRGGDIFVSKVLNNKWKTPEPMGKPINTDYWEGGACISPDGKTLYFTSERKGGLGNSDIWVVQRISKKEWGVPVNMGAPINSPSDEAGLFLAPDGKTLFFCSNNANSMGGYDIFRTRLEDGKWTTPENLGYPINTVKRDGPLVMSADTRYAYFSTDRPGGFGESDIYKIDLQEYALLEKDFKHHADNTISILKGLVRDGIEGTPLANADITLTNPAGEKTNITTNENGEYLITLKGNTEYQINISRQGYKAATEKVMLPLNKTGATYTLEKQFLLNK
ncbi:MAG: PD40 domain-containing protein [Bacteroidetes bacterium]|nr:PD40 domain-containing protein [Bacteroidota bacterium]